MAAQATGKLIFCATQRFEFEQFMNQSSYSSRVNTIPSHAATGGCFHPAADWPIALLSL
jgi:hypothetical protein